jgi:hypothetical protein
VNRLFSPRKLQMCAFCCGNRGLRRIVICSVVKYTNVWLRVLKLAPETVRHFRWWRTWGHKAYEHVGRCALFSSTSSVLLWVVISATTWHLQWPPINLNALKAICHNVLSVYPSCMHVASNYTCCTADNLKWEVHYDLYIDSFLFPAVCNTNQSVKS